MKTKVKNYINEFHMINPREKIVVGVSGGADSICLLFLLHELSQEMDFELFAVHVNHQIRETAGRDEDFVAEFCQKLKIPFFVETAPVLEIAGQQGLSVEEAGRQVRFEAFSKQKKALTADKIALAHHQDDQAETVLFHLCRGCGVEGMQGIKPVRQDVIHPLLCVSRQEIEVYLKQKALSFVEDETNAETVYSRNVLRHVVLPVLEERICNGSAFHIAQTADICREAADYLSSETKLIFDKVVERKQTGFHIGGQLLKEHPYMQKSVVHDVLSEAAGSRKDIASVHIDQIIALFDKQTGRKINLPYNLLARRDYEGVMLCKDSALTEEFDKDIVLAQKFGNDKEKSIILEPDTNSQEYNFSDGRTLLLSVFEVQENVEVPEKTYTKWFDYDKIEKSLVLRTRQTGDYIYVADGQKQTVKAYMINEKIPSGVRNEIALIAEGDHVLWMVGYRISSFYKITSQTKRVLQMQILGGKEDGREDTCNDL